VSVAYPDVSVLPPSYTPEPDSIFGPIISGGDVEDWCFAVLQKWSCTYLAEVERQHDIPPGSLPPPKGWVPATSFAKWSEDQVPALILACTGMTEAPLKSGDGSYRARWLVRLQVLCSGRTQAIARRLAHLYVAAHANILTQRPSLEGHAAGVVWMGENYTLLEPDDVRSLSAGEALFQVEVDGVRFANAGPVTPSEPQAVCEEPWPPWTTANLVQIEVEDDGITIGSVTVAPPYVSPYPEQEGD
jgi:hypothetical protein